jgi:hypothetical protein
MGASEMVAILEPTFLPAISNLLIIDLEIHGAIIVK